MGQRNRGRRLDPERALEISINGTARRRAADNTDTLTAVAELRELAGDRTDVMAKELGAILGGYLGSPLSSPLDLKAAYLLALAGGGEEHALLVESADVTRRNAGGSAYSL